MLKPAAIVGSNKIFQSLLKPTLFFVIWWSLFRISTMVLLQEKIMNQSLLVWLDALFTGLRFDFLVWGFIWILPVLLISALGLIGWIPRSVMILFKAYFTLMWACSILISGLDVMKMMLVSQRIGLSDWGAVSELYQHFLTEFGPVTFFSLSFALFVIFLSQTVFIVRAKPAPIHQQEVNVQRAQIVGRLIGPIFLVALAARGTLTAHHLRKEHSLVSDNAVLNQLVLSPMWTLNK